MSTVHHADYFVHFHTISVYHADYFVHFHTNVISVYHADYFVHFQTIYTGGHRTRVAAVTLDNMAERVSAQREDLP